MRLDLTRAGESPAGERRAAERAGLPAIETPGVTGEEFDLLAGPPPAAGTAPEIATLAGPLPPEARRLDFETIAGPMTPAPAAESPQAQPLRARPAGAGIAVNPAILGDGARESFWSFGGTPELRHVVDGWRAR